MEALPVLPSLVALIVADPAATPITRPFPFTVAIAPLVLAHVTTRPDNAPPLALRGVAVNCHRLPHCDAGGRRTHRHRRHRHRAPA